MIAADSEQDVRYRVLSFLGFSGYRVGTDGSLWSRVRRGGRYRGDAGSYLCETWTRMKPRRIVCLHCEGASRVFQIQHLVLFAFVGPRPEGMECCHNNGKYNDNRLCNLRWDTHKNNEADKIGHGTNVGNRGNIRGEDNYLAVFTNEEVVRIRELYATGDYSQKQLARWYDTSQSQIARLVRGESWTHVGGPISKIGKGRGNSSELRKTNIEVVS